MKTDLTLTHLMQSWPEDILPLQPVGRLVLNKNINNFFAENEQLAFCPATVVPGVYYSDDKLHQTRIFCYPDSQRHRLGPNYLLPPATAPKCDLHNNHREGFMNFITAMKSAITSLQGMILFVMQKGSPFLLLSLMGSVKSAQSRRRTTSSNPDSDTDLGHLTGKKDLSADGLRHYLTHLSPMKSAASGYHTGLRLTVLLVKR